MSNIEPEALQSSSELRALNKYKRRLLIEVIALCTFCLLFLFERIFYQVILHSESNYLHRFQLSNHLVTEIDGASAPADILNSFYRFWSSLSQFNFQFLLWTHIFISLYVAFNSAIATKVMLMSLAIIQIVTFLQLIYRGARPYWIMDNISSSGCLQSYNHPDLGIILLLFIPAYTYYCWQSSFKTFVGSYRNKCNAFGFVTLLALIALFLFLNYATGTVFIINICFSFLFALLFYIILTYANSSINKSLKLILRNKYSKSYQVKWLFAIIVSTLFVFMAYSASQSFQNIIWIRNYVTCKKELNQEIPSGTYDKIIGPWFNLKQTAACFAWIAAILGVTYCSSNMKSHLWCKGTPKQRIFNLIVCNLLLAPSWVFEVVLKKEQWIIQLGLNSFIVDGIHYFILYFWLFGYMPPFLLQNLLKTTEGLSYDDTGKLQTK